MPRVARRKHAEDHDEDEDAEEGERHVVAAEAAARKRPRAFAFDLGPTLFRRQLGGGVEAEFLLAGAGGRHGCVGGSDWSRRRGGGGGAPPRPAPPPLSRVPAACA